MTYKAIIKDIYTKNKCFIRLYLAFALCACVFLFYSGENSLISNAAALSQEDNAVLGGTFTTAFLLVANNANIPISPPVALSCTALMSIWNEAGTLPEQLQNFSFGLMDLWGVRIFVFAWAIISVLPRCSQFTRIGGLVIEDIDQKMGKAASCIVTVSQVLANFNGGNISYAASATVVPTQSHPAFLNIALCFLLLTGLLVCFLFIRTFLFFIDIVQLPVCTVIPMTSVVSEIIKIAGVVLMYALAVFAPFTYGACYGVLLLVSFLFFKKAYISVRYFKSIYVKPLFKRIKGFDKNISLICPHAPGRILHRTEGTDLKLLLPVYALQRTTLSPFIQRHDKWWLAVSSEKCCLYKYQFFKQQLLEIPLNTETEHKIFLKNSFRFFEIFSLTDEAPVGRPFRKLKKIWHFVYSNEYHYRLDEILLITGFADYDQYAAQKKNEQKLLRKKKKA